MNPAEWYRWIPEQISAQEYEALPEDFCATIEVIDGHIVKCESPSLMHDRVGRRLAAALERHRKPLPSLMVATDVEVRVCDVPLNLRRPDVAVFRSLPNDARLYSSDTLLVAEVVSPDSSFRTDTIGKKAIYAAAGIPAYLIVFFTEASDAVELIEEYRLADHRYHLVGVHTRRLTMTSPTPIDVSFEELISD